MDKSDRMNNRTTDFYQSKYNYFGGFCFASIIIACITSMAYFVSDCQLTGGFAYAQVIPRGIIIFPLIAYIILYKKGSRNYKVMSIATYIVAHLVSWNTIWAISNLPDQSHVNEGFIVLQIMFFAIEFATPFLYALFAHLLFIGDLVAAYYINYFEDFDVMMSVGIPCCIAIIAAQYYMEKLYIKHYHVMERIRHISLFDPLTGAYNRNIIREITDEKEGGFIEKLGDSVAVIMFDFDHFKSINDTYGHISGDTVLVEIIGEIKKHLRKEDYIIRWGGEEFVIILPGCELENAKQKAELLREAIEEFSCSICPVTISLGVAAYDNESYKAAIDNADQALYKAKNNGRNMVCYY